MASPSTPAAEPDRRLLIAAIVVGVLAVLYGVLVAGQILAPIALLAWVFLVYLAWRFVRAHERIADAAERLAADGGGDPAAAPGSAETSGRDDDEGDGRRDRP
jgi:hypothetical protein